MVIGHTPVDSAFTAYGLLGAGRVLDMLLSMPVLALVFIVALIGLYKAIGLSVTRASAAPFWTFLIVNVGAFYFFSAVTPLSVGDVQSAAKAAGAKERRTLQEDFPAGAASAGNTSGGLLLIVRAMNGVMFGAARLVNADFISAPMALARGVALAMEWDIANPALREETSQFKRKCYDPAVTLYTKGQVALARADGQPFDPQALAWDRIWPGSPDLVPFYNQINSAGIAVTGGTERSCVDWWQAIRAEAIEREVPRIQTLVGPWKQMTTHVGAALAGKDTDDEYLKLMTRHFARDPLTSQEISEERAARATGYLQAVAGGAASISNRFNLGTRALMIAAYGPYVQGAAMAILLYLFPLVMVFLLLPGWGHYLVNYFVVFAWLRSWTVGWALADNITDIVAASGIVVDASFAENVTALGATTSVVSSILYIAAPFILAILIGGGATALASVLGFSGIGIGSFISFGTRVAGMVTGRFMR